MRSYPTCAPLRRRLALSKPTQSGFTLIELLTVIAVVAVLASISLGVMGAVRNQASVGQTKAQLAVLAQALESYKKQYGDYPQTGTAANDPSGTASQTDGPGILFNALLGKRGPSAATAVAMNQRPLVELDRFTVQAPSALPDPTTTTNVANAFVDPWGQRYLYYYKTNAAWVSPGFVLFSVGPDATAGFVLQNSGQIPASVSAQASDNIYTQR